MMSLSAETLDSPVRRSRVVALAHPLVKHHLTHLRNATTPSAEFRMLIQRLSVFLAYEATKDLPIETRQVRTPLAETIGHAICEKIALVPILRAGLGMVDPILNLIPEAQVWHLGIYRDEVTLQPVEYYSKLPPNRPVDTALVLDPMLATGGSVLACSGRLAGVGCFDDQGVIDYCFATRRSGSRTSVSGGVPLRGGHRPRTEFAQVHRARIGRRRRPDVQHVGRASDLVQGLSTPPSHLRFRPALRRCCRRQDACIPGPGTRRRSGNRGCRRMPSHPSAGRPS